MNRYLIHYPKGEDGPYEIYAGDLDTLDHVGVILVNLGDKRTKVKLITRREAIRLGWTIPRALEKQGKRPRGGFATGGPGVANLKHALELSAMASKWKIENMVHLSVAGEANIMFRS
jgi:hypothetical protein